MALGDAADKSERPEGIEALAVIGSELPAFLLLRDLPDRGQEEAFGRTVGEDIEHILILRQMLLCVGQELFGDTAVIDPRSEADPVISGQVGLRLLCHADQRDIVLRGDRIQQFFVFP